MTNLPKKHLTRKDEITEDFLKMVDEHMTELMTRPETRRLSSSDFAAKLFIAPRHLTNTIKLTTGKSPCEVMEERITLEAEKLLSETTLSVAEIAYKFGYQEPTNFIKFFKGMAGITPLQYRKRLNIAA
jgi:AraC family transcriptional regulator of adaptative response / methylphosphotriester-DNA alkyltransferase methyltransferase